MENTRGEIVWYTVLDSTTGKNFYANPLTGDCSWKKPTKGKVVEGMFPIWWEMYDSDSKSPYYFNTNTQQTLWKMPNPCPVFPIPLSSQDDSHLRRVLGTYNGEEIEDIENTEYIIEDDAIDENEAEETVDKNWEEHVDPRTGYKYYLHRRTQKLTWSMLEAFQETLKEEDLRILNKDKIHPRVQDLPPTPPVPSNAPSRVNSEYHNKNKVNNENLKKPLKVPPKTPVKKTEDRSNSPLPKQTAPLPIPKSTKNVVSSKSESKLPMLTRNPSSSFSHNPVKNDSPPLPVPSQIQITRAPAKSFSDKSKKPSIPPPPIPQIPSKISNQTSPKSSIKFSQAPNKAPPPIPKSPSPMRKHHPKLSRVNTVGSTKTHYGVSHDQKSSYNDRSESPTINKISSSVLQSLETVVVKGLKQTHEFSSSPPRNKHNSDRPPHTEPVVENKQQSRSNRSILKSYSFANRKTLSSRDTNPPRPIMTDQLRKQLNFFQLEGFAQQYFKNVKKGIFRKTVPLRDRLKWSKDPIKDPLLKLNKLNRKKAINLFKNLQIFMGDRSPTTSYEERLKVLEENMTIGLNMGELRDEIYCQLCKQTTLNPNEESLERGWALMTLISQFFPPTKNLEPWLEEYLKENEKNANSKFKKYISFTILKLPSISRQGAQLRIPSTSEIDHSLKSALREPIFSSTLHEVNKSHQKGGDVPRILTTLLERLRELGAEKTEGIFRIPGSVDEVTRMKIQIENGDYNLVSYTDPHVPASVLKLWFRSLDEPLIPSNFYWDCINSSKEDDPKKMTKILKTLPKLNYNVLLIMTNYLKNLIKPENQKLTKMGIQNIAIVFGPNFVRCPDSDPGVILRTQQYEQNFMISLIRDFNG